MASGQIQLGDVILDPKGDLTVIGFEYGPNWREITVRNARGYVHTRTYSGRCRIRITRED